MEKSKKNLAGFEKKTFKPKKTIQKGSKMNALQKLVRITIKTGNVQLACELPEGENFNEWLAVNTIEFYNEINVLYGILTEFCTTEICPTMSAGPKYEYLWADGHNVKTPLKVSASEYIDFLMTWVENQLNNEKIFPCAFGVPFPKNYINIIKVIFKRLFRVYAHIYHTHFQHIMMLSLEAHLNTCFKHFIYFINHYNLVEQKELAPLAELIHEFNERLKEKDQCPTLKKIDSHKQKPRGDLSDTGIINEQPTESLNDNQEDSFQRMYSKELDLDEDEVPIILHELNDSAIHFISRDQYDRALQLLQKAQTLIDVSQLQFSLDQRLQFQRNPNDRFIVLLTMHNMALCFQKLGALEECALCLEASLQSINSPFLLPKFQGDPQKKLKKLKYECKAHMQVCALLSQLHRHKEALQHAEKSVQISQYMMNDLLQMCQHYYGKVVVAKKNEQIAQELLIIGGDQNDQQQQMNKELIYYDDSVSMLERTAYRILPIIQEVASRMIKSPNQEETETETKFEISDILKQKLNMKAVLGYLNQSEWLYLLNIGNIMQITPLTVHDLYSNQSFEVELTRDSILEKISFLAVSYFCISTELRFLVQIKDDPAIDPAMKKKESEFWHAKALEISCSFLPSECPLVSHILSSYQKHHSPVNHEIPEDQETTLALKVVRPLAGIDICKYQPMVRQDESLNISIHALPLSPNNYGKQKKSNQTQIISLPFSPNNNATTAASQNNMFSSQLVNNKIQTTDSTSSNLVSTQRQNNPQNRFNKNRNNVPANLRNLSQQQINEISGEAVEAEQQDLEQSRDDNEHSDLNNKSMMDVVPSANYKQLLHDFNNMQNSSDIIEEDAGDHQDQFFEIEEDMSNNVSGGQQTKHQDSQEIEIIQDNLKNRRRQINNVSEKKRSKLYHNESTLNNRVLDISQEILNHEGEDEEEDINQMDDDEDDDLIDLIKERSFQVRSKCKQKQPHNLSVDGQKIRRPQTSQGIRKQTKQPKHLHSGQNNTVRTQQMQCQDLKMIKTTSTLQIVPSADGISPHNGPIRINGARTHHNQSMNTNQSKINKIQTVTNGFNIGSQNQSSGLNTDQKGNSTPLRGQHSVKGKSGQHLAMSRENMNITRGNADKLNQSNCQELASSGKRTKSINKRNRYFDTASGAVSVTCNINNGKRNTHTQLNFNNGGTKGMRIQGQRSNSQQKQNQTNSASKQKSKPNVNLQDTGMPRHLIMQQQQQNQSQPLLMTQEQLQQNPQKALNDFFMMERLTKKRSGEGGNIHTQESKAFDMVHQQINDPKYSSQHLSNSNSRSKGRSKNNINSSSGRSKDKTKSKSSEQQAFLQPSTNIEELKRQILLKQALIDSNTNSRRKSAGAMNALNVSAQQQFQTQSAILQKKRIENSQSGISQLQQQLMMQTSNNQHNHSQQIAMQQQPSIQKHSKLNTHQLIKKFLIDRTNLNTQTSGQIISLNNSAVENYQTQGSNQPDLSLYKLELQKKIMLQQNKLLDQQQHQPLSHQQIQPKRKKQGDQYNTESYPQKRSATPMMDFYEEDVGVQRMNAKAQKNSIGKCGNKQDKTLFDSGNFQMFSGMNSNNNNNYMSVQDYHNNSLRDDSFTKSMKKKVSKKVTPKNVLANSQFNWI